MHIVCLRSRLIGEVAAYTRYNPSEANAGVDQNKCGVVPVQHGPIGHECCQQLQGMVFDCTHKLFTVLASSGNEYCAAHDQCCILGTGPPPGAAAPKFDLFSLAFRPHPCSTRRG